MNCSKCGAPMEKDAAFCPKCGAKAETRASADEILCPKCGAPTEIGAEFCVMCGASLEEVQPKEDTPENKVFTRLSLLLTVIGVGLGFLIFLISWIAYGRVYFFGGYDITVIGWIASFLGIAAGIALFVAGVLKRRHNAKRLKKRVILMGALILFFIVIMAASGIINAVYEKNHAYTPSYDASFYMPQNGSCHTTEQHIIAIHAYDLDGDNSISAWEMELFIEDHPRIGYDQGFIDYFS